MRHRQQPGSWVMKFRQRNWGTESCSPTCCRMAPRMASMTSGMTFSTASAQSSGRGGARTADEAMASLS